MTKRDEVLEGSVIWLQALSFGPALLFLVLDLFGHLPPLICLPISFVLGAGLNLYSMISTGWATDKACRARYKRDGTGSFSYWIRLNFFAVFGIFSLVALVATVTKDAA